MDVIYWLIPSMIFVGVVLVILLMISIKNGQFDDLEGEGWRILFDEEQTNLELKKNMKNKVNNSSF
ncbi:cytochrome oxidase maturation protein, cbb3-type [Abyssogena phaseoliformis symbiont OG214]|uniref:cbb3-type cytochrome oxidase assembly protein CcoS n=1 Tax=Abyssogena phaseoliformis symbiont TaxID=596095 RepID=UPI001914DA8D|nr:cbb3-type cytochrome oxidase assembly protein CcoS [Abyssogena phaseoliformis symbiont]BBB23197.1 cytochrome oxidase maturation protein, cbb3-type [Abyssogena phaseoliformis symbiont OG214]